MIIFQREDVGLLLTHHATQLRHSLSHEWGRTEDASNQWYSPSGDRIIRCGECGTPSLEQVRSVIGRLPSRIFCFVINPLESHLKGKTQTEWVNSVDAWYRWEDGPDAAFQAENLIFKVSGTVPEWYTPPTPVYTETQIRSAWQSSQAEHELLGYSLDATKQRWNIK